MSLADEEDIFKESEVPLEEDDEEEEEEEEEEDEEVEQDDNGENNEDEVDGEEGEDEDEDEGDEDENDENGDNEDEGDDDNNNNDEDEEMTESNNNENQQEAEIVPKGEKSKLETFYDQMKFKAKLADSYEVNPFGAIPYACPINAIALSSSSKWLFTGGDDGFIRKYDFFSSVDGEVQLTAAQKHSLVDSITNGGALMGYWENEIPIKKSLLTKDTYEPKLSPVFSLAIENRCLWLLSGLSSGGISLQSIRHNEGSIVHHFEGHQDTVSVLKLNQPQDRFISGSWDKLIHNWDLNTGAIINTFRDATGQISSLEYRPSNAIDIEVQPINDNEDEDMDSLFGDSDDEDGQDSTKVRASKTRQSTTVSSTTTTNQGLDDNIFMSSSIDGSINIWDLRTNQQALRLKAAKGTPPWCVSSCWSTDGNFIYAGRRNSTVDEISLRMPLNSNGETKVSKTLKFPQVSGAVTVVRPLANGNHLLCGSYDNIRIYDLRLYEEAQRKTPFLIVPGHHGGTLSDVQFDPTSRYMISASGNRGWQGSSTETVFIYDVELQ